MAVGEGNGTPLLYSCLENPMDGATTGTNLENTILSKKKASHRNPPVACFIDVKCPEWQIHRERELTGASLGLERCRGGQNGE